MDDDKYEEMVQDLDAMGGLKRWIEQKGLKFKDADFEFFKEGESEEMSIENLMFQEYLQEAGHSETLWAAENSGWEI